MPSQVVLELYSYLAESGIIVWLDGGWCVDALLGRELRPHKDLDIAIDWKGVQRLRSALEERGYREVRQESQYNFVLADDRGNEVGTAHQRTPSHLSS